VSETAPPRTKANTTSRTHLRRLPTAYTQNTHQQHKHTPVTHINLITEPSQYQSPNLLSYQRRPLPIPHVTLPHAPHFCFPAPLRCRACFHKSPEQAGRRTARSMLPHSQPCGVPWSLRSLIGPFSPSLASSARSVHILVSLPLSASHDRGTHDCDRRSLENRERYFVS